MWTVVYFHHPPYTKTSHNSDAEIELIRMRENFIRILERNGVDLVLSGHSHGYEGS
jgi:acid phosphatase type 7